MLRITLAAAAMGVVGAVTEETNTPTNSSNYMVMQGNIGYVSTVGGIDGRIQMVRSALTSTTSFSYSLHFAQGALAPATGTVITARLGRHVCAIGFTPYQDPYQCPGYLIGTNTNTCPSSPAVEVSIPCTVDANGACAATFDWGIYIPEVFEGQQLEDLSLYFSSGSNRFACANFGASRVLALSESTDPRNTPDSQGSIPMLIMGEVEKDELGYTHLFADFDDLTASADYSIEVATTPCSTSTESFGTGAVVGGLAYSFTSDFDGTAELDFFTTVIEPATTQSVILREGGDVIKCFSLEIGVSSIQSRVAQQALSDGCAVWEDFYTAGELAGKGKKGKFATWQRSGKKGGKERSASLDSEFQSVDVGGTSRCCKIQSDDNDNCDDSGMGGKKGRCHRAGGLFDVSTSSKAQTGLGAGVAGAIILAVGVAMHVRRRSNQVQPSEVKSAPEHVGVTDINEKTPLAHPQA